MASKISADTRQSARRVTKASMATTFGDEQSATKQQVAEEVAGLNFKVPVNFKRAFKGYAVSRGMTMVELLREGFELVRHQRRD